MKFSECYHIDSEAMDGCFDPVLSIDTKLFIDQFLVYSFGDGVFQGSHDEVINFFNSVFHIIARASEDYHSAEWRKAVNLLQFPEVEELCLGYTGQGTGGAGSRAKIGHMIANGLLKAIKQGKKDIRHFEEVQILEEGIGADRISDATAWIIRHRLMAYTADLCQRFDVPTKSVTYRQGRYSADAEQWEPISGDLPLNPYNRKPILLIPEKFLRPLPTINPDEFWSYCFNNDNAALRREYGEDIARKVDKASIIKLAHNHPELREQYLRAVEQVEAKPYNFSKDPKGLVNWYAATADWCRQHPLKVSIHGEDDFSSAIGDMVAEFENYVSHNKGWSLLWNDNRTPKSEEAAQNLFLGVVKHYCKAADIDISREANIGRGPVDFKLSHGYERRMLLEMKLAKNTKFWNGLAAQLPTYLTAEGIAGGYFMVVCYTDKDYERIHDIQRRVKEVKQKVGYEIQISIVDARVDPLSASKLRKVANRS